MNGLLIHNWYYVFNKIILLFFFIISAIGSYSWFIGRLEVYKDKIPYKIYEYPFYTLLLIFFSFVLLASFDIITMYLSFEGMSLILMIIVLFNNSSFKNSEAALKYFCLSVFTSGLLVFGLSMIYGLVGSTNFFDIKYFFSESDPSLYWYESCIIIFVLTSVLFKLGAAPYHLWLGEVYEGTETPVTLLLMVPIKIVFFGLLIKLTNYIFLPLRELWFPIISIFSVFSLIFGVLMSLVQDNLKKFFAVASVNQVGFLLLSLQLDLNSISAAYTHLIGYVVASWIILVTLLIFNSTGSNVIYVSDLQKAFSSSPALVYPITIAILSLAGIPPLFGFFSKYIILRGAINSNISIYILLIAFITNLISAYYYIRVIKNIFWVKNSEANKFKYYLDQPSLYLLSFLSIILITGVVFLDPMWSFINEIEMNLIYPISSLDAYDWNICEETFIETFKTLDYKWNSVAKTVFFIIENTTELKEIVEDLEDYFDCWMLFF